jgi:hypothetical protein
MQMRTVAVTITLAVFGVGGACSPSGGVVPLTGDSCWPKLSEGQTAAGNIHVYVNSSITAAYSPSCDDGALVLVGSERFLEAELAAFERLTTSESVFSISFPAYVSADVIRTKRNQLMLDAKAIRRVGEIKTRKLPPE